MNTDGARTSLRIIPVLGAACLSLFLMSCSQTKEMDPFTFSDKSDQLDTSGASTTADKCTAEAVLIDPNENIADVVGKKRRGASFCITEGEYRMTEPIVPKSGDVLVFEPGATLNGSRLVENWTFDGTYWSAKGQPQSFTPPGDAVPCELNPAACEYEDLFIDDRPLERVLQLSEVQPGRFYFDETADTIYMVDDPTGHKMETPVTTTAINARGAENVTVRGATIEKFGLNGIVALDGWRILDNEIRYVHSHGLRVFGTSTIARNYIHHAGNMGIFGSGDGLVFDSNHLAYNNYLNFGKETGYWHAGATKIIESDGTIVRNNWSHNNTGDGWWFDTDNINTVIEGNTFEDNARYGVFYEASHKAVIRNNIFRRNGQPKKWWGAGVWISASKDVDIYRNIFKNNRYSTLALCWTDRGLSETYGERQTSNVYVHDNVFKLRRGFVGVPFGKPEIYTSNNRFEDNTYIVPSSSGTWWRWNNDSQTLPKWRSFGQDVTSSIRAG
jgi:parallel beta-helix repeat protein